jgi:ABC-2 type transport system ATP-binding protein
MSNALVVENLNKSFPLGLRGRKMVLKNVQFKVPAGSITGFVGANGSGKTTTVKSILQFIFPDSSPAANISFFGKGPLDLSVRARLGYLPERPYLPDQLTAEEFLKFHWDLSEVKGVSKDRNFQERCEEVLASVKLQHARKQLLRTFSKGMLQRIGLAQAILRNPDFLILDEPMSGLDPDGRWLVKQIIKEQNAKGSTIFFSSHLLSDMDELCSTLVVIDLGEVLFNGTVQDFVGSGISLGKNIEEAFAQRLRNRRENT